MKFFDQYRDLRDELAKLGVGDGKDIPIDAPFPKTHRSSTFGVKMGEDALQERCYVLNKWMQAVFVNYSKFSPAAQVSLLPSLLPYSLSRGCLMPVVLAESSFRLLV